MCENVHSSIIINNRTLKTTNQSVKWIDYFRCIPQWSSEYSTENTAVTHVVDDNSHRQVICLAQKGTYSLNLFTESSGKDNVFL